MYCSNVNGVRVKWLTWANLSLHSCLLGPGWLDCAGGQWTPSVLPFTECSGVRPSVISRARYTKKSSASYSKNSSKESKEKQRANISVRRVCLIHRDLTAKVTKLNYPIEKLPWHAKTFPLPESLQYVPGISDVLKRLEHLVLFYLYKQEISASMLLFSTGLVMQLNYQ